MKNLAEGNNTAFFIFKTIGPVKWDVSCRIELPPLPREFLRGLFISRGE